MKVLTQVPWVKIYLINISFNNLDLIENHHHKEYIRLHINKIIHLILKTTNIIVTKQNNIIKIKIS